MIASTVGQSRASTVTDWGGMSAWTGKGSREVAVIAEGFGRSRQEVGERESLDFALLPGDAVKGRLVDASGTPVRGALVGAIGSRHRSFAG